MRFTKMQGAGNDYVYIDCTKEAPEDLPGLARRISDRHFGVGSDGLICAFPSARADLAMVMFNADGSRGEMCGNGIRCLGKFAYDKGMTARSCLRIETPAGIKELALLSDTNGQVVGATVDMGAPDLEEPCTLELDGTSYEVTPISMGNPHIVCFSADVKGLDLADIGPRFEHHPCFPNRVNTEFVEVVAPDRLLMRVWERGSGETMACGTGACAAAAASWARGYTGREVTVLLPGGELAIRWAQDGHIHLTGPAVTVFEGDWPEKETR